MNPETIMTIGGRALEITLMLAAPLLLVGLVTGLIVGAFQAATSIRSTVRRPRWWDSSTHCW